MQRLRLNVKVDTRAGVFRKGSMIPFFVFRNCTPRAHVTSSKKYSVGLSQIRFQQIINNVLFSTIFMHIVIMEEEKEIKKYENLVLMQKNLQC